MFGSIQNLGPRQPSHYEREPFAHATAQQQRVGAQNMSTSSSGQSLIKQDFICARSVGPFGPPEEEKGVKHMFFLFLENCFSRAAWNLFDVGNQTVPTRLASNILFGSFQCSLEGG